VLVRFEAVAMRAARRTGHRLHGSEYSMVPVGVRTQRAILMSPNRGEAGAGYRPINMTMQARSVGQLINQLSVRRGGLPQTAASDPAMITLPFPALVVGVTRRLRHIGRSGKRRGGISQFLLNSVAIACALPVPNTFSGLSGCGSAERQSRFSTRPTNS